MSTRSLELPQGENRSKNTGDLPSGQPHVLIAGSLPSTAALQAVLARDFRVRTVADLADLPALEAASFDLVLLGSDKSGNATAYKAAPFAEHTPVLQILAGPDDAGTNPAGSEPDGYLPLSLPADLLRSHLHRFIERGQMLQSKTAQATVVDAFAEPILTVDRFWRLTYANEAAEQDVIERDAVPLGQTLWHLFPEFVDTLLGQLLQQAMDDRTPVKIEPSFERRSGYFEIHVQPLPDGGLSFYFRNVARRRRAEVAAVVTESRLRLFLDHAQDYALILTDLEGRIIEWLGGACTITGWSAEDVEGKPIDLLFTEEDCRDGAPQQERAVTRAEGRTEDRRWHLRADGSRFFADGGVTLLRDDSGRVQGFAKIFRDATAQKIAEDALRESEQRLRFVMDAVPQKIFSADPDGSIYYFNAQWSEYSGRSIEELGDHALTQLVHPDETEDTLREWNHAMQSRTPFQIEHRLMDAKGHYRWHWSRAEPMRSAGRVVMWAGSSVDIHAMKTAEAALVQELEAQKRSGELLAKVADASHSLNAQLSVDRIAQVLAEEAREILDGECAIVALVSAIRGFRTFRASSPAEGEAGISDDPSALGELMHICQQQQTVRDSCRMAVPLIGPEQLLLGAVLIKSKTGQIFNEEDEAILAQLAALASVGLANAHLCEALREQDQRKDEFLAVLSHEFRNQLAPVRSGIELLRLAGKDPKTVKVRDIMERQMQHLVRLVDDLMDVSRVKRGKVELKKEPLALRAVVEMAIEANRPTIRHFQHGLVVDLTDEPLFIEGDLTRLAQVFGNLLNNAAKYTPERGTIELTLQRRDKEAVLRVKDSGLGLSREQQSRIFELFAQAESSNGRAQGGLGIGLSLVRGLVELHGGRIQVESPGVGKGSTFTVRLPLLPGRPKTFPALLNFSAENEDVATARRILVVEDNVGAADTLRMLLEMLGHTVRVAHSANAALALAKRFHPDIALVDIGLPDINGYDLASKLRAEPDLAEIPLVALTGYGNEDDRKKSQDAGFSLHLTKPVNAKDISSALSTLCSPS